MAASTFQADPGNFNFARKFERCRNPKRGVGQPDARPLDFLRYSAFAIFMRAHKKTRAR